MIGRRPAEQVAGRKAPEDRPARPHRPAHRQKANRLQELLSGSAACCGAKLRPASRLEGLPALLQGGAGLSAQFAGDHLDRKRQPPANFARDRERRGGCGEPGLELRPIKRRLAQVGQIVGRGLRAHRSRRVVSAPEHRARRQSRGCRGRHGSRPAARTSAGFVAAPRRWRSPRPSPPGRRGRRRWWS